MVQSNAGRYKVVRIRIGFRVNVPSTAQSLRPSVHTGAPHLRPKSRLAAVGLRNTPAGVAFTQGRHEALPRQCYKFQFSEWLIKTEKHKVYYLISHI